MTSTVAEPDRGPTDSAELDAYSRVVTSVAAELTASVAALQHSERTSSGRMEGGAGSAVVFTDDGINPITGSAVMTAAASTLYRGVAVSPHFPSP